MLQFPCAVYHLLPLTSDKHRILTEKKPSYPYPRTRSHARTHHIYLSFTDLCLITPSNHLWNISRTRILWLSEMGAQLFYYCDAIMQRKRNVRILKFGGKQRFGQNNQKNQTHITWIPSSSYTILCFCLLICFQSISNHAIAYQIKRNIFVH